MIGALRPGGLNVIAVESVRDQTLASAKHPVMKAWLKMQGYLFMPVSCGLVASGWQFYLHPRHILRIKAKGEALRQQFAEGQKRRVHHGVITFRLIAREQPFQAFRAFQRHLDYASPAHDHPRHAVGTGRPQTVTSPVDSDGGRRHGKFMFHVGTRSGRNILVHDLHPGDIKDNRLKMSD